MTEQSTAEIVSVFLELARENKVDEAIERCLAASFVWDNPLPDIIPFGGRFEGHEAAARYMQLLAEAIDIEEFVVEDMICDGDRLAMTGRETSLVRNTQRRYTMQWAHFLTAKDGKLVYWREYNDTAEMLRAFS